MIISAVPRERALEAWRVVGPDLDRAIIRTHGRFHSVDVMTAVLDGTASLWVAYEENTNNIIGSLILTLSYYPGGLKVGRVDYIGGHDRDRWFDDMWDVIVRYCKQEGCDQIEGITRKGMQSYVMDRYGAKATGIFFELDLHGYQFTKPNGKANGHGQGRRTEEHHTNR